MQLKNWDFRLMHAENASNFGSFLPLAQWNPVRHVEFMYEKLHCFLGHSIRGGLVENGVVFSVFRVPQSKQWGAS